MDYLKDPPIPPHLAREKRFSIQDTRTDEDVLGGVVGERNAYVTVYGEPVNSGDKTLDQLEVGESVLRTYRLSGSSGTYRVVRMPDGPRKEGR